MGSLVAGMKLAFKDVNLKEQIMDPISLVFTAYVDSVQSTVNGSSHRHRRHGSQSHDN